MNEGVYGRRWGGVEECVSETISIIGYFDTLGHLEVYSRVILTF